MAERGEMMTSCPRQLLIHIRDTPEGEWAVGGGGLSAYGEFKPTLGPWRELFLGTVHQLPFHSLSLHAICLDSTVSSAIFSLHYTCGQDPTPTPAPPQTPFPFEVTISVRNILPRPLHLMVQLALPHSAETSLP